MSYTHSPKYDKTKLTPDLQGFVSALEKVFPDLYITSGKRDGKGDSKHNTGDAIDIRFNDKVLQYLWNTKEGVELLHDYGVGVLDESKDIIPNRENKSKWSGPHLHIGKDSGQIKYMKERYKEVVEDNKNVLLPEEVFAGKKAPITKGTMYNFLKDKGKLFDNENYGPDKDSEWYKTASENVGKQFVSKIKEIQSLEDKSDRYKQEQIDKLYQEIYEKGNKQEIDYIDNYIQKEYSKDAIYNYKQKVNNPDFNLDEIPLNERENAQQKYLKKSLELKNKSERIPLFTFKDKFKDNDTTEQKKDESDSNQSKQGSNKNKTSSNSVNNDNPIVTNAEKEVSKKSTSENSNTEKKDDEELYAVDFLKSLNQETILPDKLDYDKSKFKTKVTDLPLDAIGGLVAGAVGIEKSKTEVPLRDDEIDLGYLQYVSDLKRISKVGLSPEMEAKAKKSLADAYQLGKENIARVSAGNRNLILGNQGQLDAAKMQGIIALDAADAQMKMKAMQMYGEAMKYVSEFESKKSQDNNRTEQILAMQERKAGDQLAAVGFASVIDSIENYKANAPGTFKHMEKSAVLSTLFGYDPSMEGAKEKWLEKRAKINADNEKILNRNQLIGKLDKNGLKQFNKFATENLSKMSVEDIYKNFDFDKNYNTEKVDNIPISKSGVSITEPNVEDTGIIMPETNSPILQEQAIDFTEGGKYKVFKPGEFTLRDNDTGYDSNGNAYRLTSKNGDSFDAMEKGQPMSTGVLTTDKYGNNNPVRIDVKGKDAYNRNLGVAEMYLDGKWHQMDSLGLESDNGLLTKYQGQLSERGKRLNEQFPYPENALLPSDWREVQKILNK